MLQPDGASRETVSRCAAGFIVCRRRRGIVSVRWDWVLKHSGREIDGIDVGWGVMADAEGRCWTMRSGRCRVHHVPAPWRSYLMSAGLEGSALFGSFVSGGEAGR